MVWCYKKPQVCAGPGGAYAAFAGRDASRAFVSGKFEGDGLTDDVAGVSDADLKAIVGWRDFYHRARPHRRGFTGQGYLQGVSLDIILSDVALHQPAVRSDLL